MDHSVKDEENIVGLQQHQNKLPWGTGIWTAMWLLWVAIISGIYPIYPNIPAEMRISGKAEGNSQAEEKIEAVSTEQAESQALDSTSRRSRTEISGRMKEKNLDTESRNF